MIFPLRFCGLERKNRGKSECITSRLPVIRERHGRPPANKNAARGQQVGRSKCDNEGPLGPRRRGFTSCGLIRRLLHRVLPFVVAAFVAIPALAADPQITSEERAKLIKYLKDSQAEFFALLDGVSDAQWRWKAAPEKWSVAETAEHIAITEDFLFDLAANKAMASPALADWETKTKGKSELLESALPNRRTKVQAIEPLNPQGITMTREQVTSRFTASRAKTIQFAATTQLPLKEHTTPGLFAAFDPLNAYQLILYAPLNNLRHDQQIAEVKATPGYPK